MQDEAKQSKNESQATKGGKTSKAPVGSSKSAKPAPLTKSDSHEKQSSGPDSPLPSRSPGTNRKKKSEFSTTSSEGKKSVKEQKKSVTDSTKDTPSEFTTNSSEGKKSVKEQKKSVTDSTKDTPVGKKSSVESGKDTKPLTSTPKSKVNLITKLLMFKNILSCLVLA